MAGAFGLFQPTPFYNSMKNKVPDVSESNCKYGKHRLATVLLLCCQFSTIRMHLLDKLLGQGFGGASPNHSSRSCRMGEHLLPSLCLRTCNKNTYLGKSDHVRGLERN